MQTVLLQFGANTQPQSRREWKCPECASRMSQVNRRDHSQSVTLWLECTQRSCSGCCVVRVSR